MNLTLRLPVCGSRTLNTADSLLVLVDISRIDVPPKRMRKLRPDSSGDYRKKPMVGNYGQMGLRASAKSLSRDLPTFAPSASRRGSAVASPLATLMSPEAPL